MVNLKNLLFITLFMASFSINAQIIFKDKAGKTQIEVNEKGEIFFQGQKGAKIEESKMDADGSQDLKFYNKDGELVAQFNATTQTISDKDNEGFATIADGVLTDKATGRKIQWSKDGELVVEDKNTGLFLESNIDLFRDRALLISYFALLTSAGSEVEEN